MVITLNTSKTFICVCVCVCHSMLMQNQNYLRGWFLHVDPRDELSSQRSQQVPLPTEPSLSYEN